MRKSSPWETSIFSPMPDALDRVSEKVKRYRHARHFVLSQRLIDEAFMNDELAKAWFAVWGLTLVPGRLYGQPAMANVFRDVNGSETEA